MPRNRCSWLLNELEQSLSTAPFEPYAFGSLTVRLQGAAMRSKTSVTFGESRCLLVPYRPDRPGIRLPGAMPEGVSVARYTNLLQRASRGCRYEKGDAPTSGLARYGCTRSTWDGLERAQGHVGTASLAGCGCPSDLSPFGCRAPGEDPRAAVTRRRWWKCSRVG
jgi:hypothetical protein